MFLKIIGGLLAAVLLFLGYVSTRESKFNYERSDIIQAPAKKIFPYLSSFQLGSEWSPYEKVDPNLKRNFIGEDGKVGSIMEFEGNSDAGSGKLEFLKIVPNELVEIKLTMTKPIQGENIIVYKLTPEATGTRFSWSMSGDGGFMGKLISTLIDCDKMIGDQFNAGIYNLKTLIESQLEDDEE